MGSACCVAARDKSLLPSRTSSDVLSRNIRYSPAWNCRWDSGGRVADEVDNPPSVYSHGTSENVECGDLSERQSQPDSLTPTLEKSPNRDEPIAKSVSSTSGKVYGRVASTMPKSPIHEEASLKAISPASEPSMGSNSFHEVKDTSPTSSRLSFSSSLRPPRHHSPSYHFLRQVSTPQHSDLKSPSEGRPSFVSSDNWSLSTFSELVASSQRERWSFDSETLDTSTSRGKVTRSPSTSIDLRTCGVCLKLLIEKSPFVGQKIVATNDLSVVAVLVCGHVYHAECLENSTLEGSRFDPACPVCSGDKKGLKVYGRGKIGRNRVVDSNLDEWRREGKGPKLGSSSSMKSSFAKPFLKRHFSLGSKSSDFGMKSPGRKGFWSRYRKG